MTKPYRNILLTRTDRIGDVILSLPVSAAIKNAWPGATVTFLARDVVEPVIRMCPWVDGYIVFEDTRPVEDLTKELRGRQFDAAVCLYPRASVASLLKNARIPVRVGSGRRLYSFRFNKRVNVSRAAGGKHERDFNLDLLKGLGLKSPRAVNPLCVPSPEAVEEAQTLLGTSATPRDAERPSVVLHPGCGGSARNWPVGRYQALCRYLVENGVQVILSGSTVERELVSDIAGDCSASVINIAGATSLETLAGILHIADLFIGPSTGPMHLAAAVGCPVLALFGPVRTTTPDRWGPLGEGHAVFTPGVPECQCKVDHCKLGDCMERIDVQSVGERAIAMAQAHHRASHATYD